MKKLGAIQQLLLSDKGKVLLDQGVFSATSFLTTILLARQLGIDQFGVYSSLVLYLFLLLSISNALIIAPFQVLAAHESGLPGYQGALVRLQLLVIGLFSIVTYFLLTWNTRYLQVPPSSYGMVVLVVVGFLLHDFIRRLLLATQQFNKALLLDVVTGAAQIIWLLAAGWQGKINLPYSLLIIAATYLPAAFFTVMLLWSARSTWLQLQHFTLEHLHHGRWLLLAAVLQWWANNFLVVASGLFLGIRALGALRLAQSLMGVLNILLQVYDNYILPQAALMLKESSSKMKQYLLQTIRQSCWLLLPILIACFVFARSIFSLCGGADYIEYAYALQGFCILYVFIFGGYPIRIAIRALLMNREFFIAYCLSFLTSLFSARFLMQEWALTGVIVALIINQIVMLGYWNLALARKNFYLWK